MATCGRRSREKGGSPGRNTPRASRPLGPCAVSRSLNGGPSRRPGGPGCCARGSSNAHAGSAPIRSRCQVGRGQDSPGWVPPTSWNAATRAADGGAVRPDPVGSPPPDRRTLTSADRFSSIGRGSNLQSAALLRCIQPMLNTVFYPRPVDHRVVEALEDSPVALIHGPRQCGKTTPAPHLRTGTAVWRAHAV